MTMKQDKNIKATSELNIDDSEPVPIPASIATTSRDPPRPLIDPDKKRPILRRFGRYLYDRDRKTFCDRTCGNWGKIIGYSIMYLILLCTYTMILLFTALSIIKATVDFRIPEKIEHLTYSTNGVGLTATPIDQDSGSSLIWFIDGDMQMQKYIASIDKFLSRRKPADLTKLGSCGRFPYGYGKEPCVIISINKRINWAGKPMAVNSSVAQDAPKDVKEWMSSGKHMLWLHCEGYHAYDREHLRRIEYHPHPPGFDPELFPIDIGSDSPLVAVQLVDFTKGISLAIDCKLWYDFGPSTVDFVIYVKLAESFNGNNSII